MQPLSPNDYIHEMRGVDHMRDAIRAAIRAAEYAGLVCATEESEQFYTDMRLQLEDMLSDIDGLDTKIDEASEVKYD